MPRFFCAAPLLSQSTLDLPEGAARHVQVLRLQPGDAITLFNQGPGWGGPSPAGEFDATITHIGRSTVTVRVGEHHAIEREPSRAVHLAIGMPANDRMDWLVEKASELGVASIQPLMTERSVLRLSGERALKKVAHWQSVAIAACEQCGGNRVPTVHPVHTLADWLASAPARTAQQGFVLSLAQGNTPLPLVALRSTPLYVLSGPEGGLSCVEEAGALKAGLAPVTLGQRTLRAETAALGALVALLMRN